ncbi:MAG: hypothetical protein ACOY94_27840 [Bacillota bacterium]
MKEKEKQKEPGYAPGQELTLHPNDDMRGAELLRENLRKREGERRQGDREDLQPRF